jgi:hypothetical protein
VGGASTRCGANTAPIRKRNRAESHRLPWFSPKGMPAPFPRPALHLRSWQLPSEPSAIAFSSRSASERAIGLATFRSPRYREARW